MLTLSALVLKQQELSMLSFQFKVTYIERGNPDGLASKAAGYVRKKVILQLEAAL